MSRHRSTHRRFVIVVFRFWLLAISMAVVLVTPPALVQADDYWGVSTGTWSVASNWGGKLPGLSDTAWIINGGTTTINTATQGTCYNLSLGNSAGSGTAVMTGGSLSVGSDLCIGGPIEDGAGTFTQSGGTNNIGVGGGVQVAAGAGKSATYNLTGTGLLLSSGDYVGGWNNGAVSTFTQSGGTHIVTYDLQIDGVNATYNLTGGSLSAQALLLGTGNFNQSGGTNTPSLELLLGSFAGDKAQYTLSGISLLRAPMEYVGDCRKHLSRWGHLGHHRFVAAERRHQRHAPSGYRERKSLSV